MIHVLLILLKFLGIFLLFLLGLIFLILAAPIRYSFHFHAGEEASFGGQIKVTWLLGILYIRGSYIEKIFEYRVRIFGYQILGNQKEFLEKKQKRERKKQKKRNKKSEKSKNKENVPAPLKQEESCGDDRTAKQEMQPEEKVSPEQEGTCEECRSAEKAVEPMEKKPSSTDRFREKTTGRLDSLRKKIHEFREAYQEYHGKQLMDFAKQSIIKILRHVLPRRMRGFIRFGFDDPAVTGIVTGGAALFYPKYRDTLVLEPDFGQECFEADCRGRGRIHPGFFLYMGLKALWNPDVRALLKKLL
ncbi:MAG TPA: DUF2953 domain-containing protein [Candidatus Anaerobutyricum stercoripullorum]|uniref:DUF2953 domain-containing protein n=1 Tax=Candidatus Anaerobutyricum stercoripullorum TaxID=2838456 RepID=A0A9D1X4L8_9FIRM|nr:DUF2953 domain-containing protein [Candidatus Anaerobutyricum stercoripullorum]